MISLIITLVLAIESLQIEHLFHFGSRSVSVINGDVSIYDANKCSILLSDGSIIEWDGEESKTFTGLINLSKLASIAYIKGKLLVQGEVWPNPVTWIKFNNARSNRKLIGFVISDNVLYDFTTGDPLQYFARNPTSCALSTNNKHKVNCTFGTQESIIIPNGYCTLCNGVLRAHSSHENSPAYFYSDKLKSMVKSNIDKNAQQIKFHGNAAGPVFLTYFDEKRGDYSFSLVKVSKL